MTRRSKGTRQKLSPRLSLLRSLPTYKVNAIASTSHLHLLSLSTLSLLFSLLFLGIFALCFSYQVEA